MASFNLFWEDEREKEIVRQLLLDWHLYGEIHMTNANGLTRLDPTRITYLDEGDNTPLLQKESRSRR